MRRRDVPWSVVIGVCSAVIAACGSDPLPKPAARKLDSAAAVTTAAPSISPDTAERTLAYAAGVKGYHIDDAEGPHGTISGIVHLKGVLPRDTMVVPDHDATGCRTFLDVTMPVPRTSRASKEDSTTHDVGNALVWLIGVTHGPRDLTPRRISVVLDDCHIDPRVLVAQVGATVNTTNRDDMLSTLRFTDYGQNTLPRATIGFTDPGQVVPSALPLARPGLVEVTDAKHAWVRAYIAVAPHPFVAVTEADGTFVFDGVPPGSYQLVAWHERLKSRVMPVRVQAGVTTTLTVSY